MVDHRPILRQNERVKIMKPKLVEGKWYIEVPTEDFGNVLLLNSYTELAMPLQFENENEALEYIKIKS